MLPITLGLLLTVALAIVVLIAVSLPNLRSGSRILTPEGERVVERAKEQARRTPGAAAGTTWQGLVRLGDLGMRAWRPVSAGLHDGLDRLERRDTVPGLDQPAAPAVPAAPVDQIRPIEPVVEPAVVEPVVVEPSVTAAPSVSPVTASLKVAEARWPVSTRFDVEAVIGRRGVGRPRSMPVDSGPIPQISDRPVIDLRQTPQADPDPDPDADRGAAVDSDWDSDARPRAGSPRRSG